MNITKFDTVMDDTCEDVTEVSFCFNPTWLQISVSKTQKMVTLQVSSCFFKFYKPSTFYFNSHSTLKVNTFVLQKCKFSSIHFHQFFSVEDGDGVTIISIQLMLIQIISQYKTVAFNKFNISSQYLLAVSTADFSK